MHAAVTLSVPQLESLQNPLVVAAFRGWHDATGSGVAAVRYLRTELQAVEVASLDPDRFYDLTVGRPHVQLQGGERVIRWPGTRCYVARGVAPGQDVVFLAGREPSLAWRSYCDAIVEVLERGKTPEVIAACRARAEDFSWAALGPVYERLVRDVVSPLARPDLRDELHRQVEASIARGAERAGRSLKDIDLQAGGAVAFGDDLPRLIEERRRGLAFSLGAMGSREHNFYNIAYQRAGYEDVAKEVQRLYLDGHRKEAAALVPDEMVLQTNLLGTDDMVRDRIRAYRNAGVTTLRLQPEGATLNARLETLGRAMDLVRQVSAESQPAVSSR